MMDRLGIIGAAWRQVTTQGLEKFMMPVEQQAERLPQLKQALDVEELIFLSTCNRVEILFARGQANRQASLEELRRRAYRELVGDEPAAGEAERSLRVWAGEGALEHLMMVACGLDSAQLGEREIRGQLRDSHRRAKELELSGPILEWTVEHALRLARRIEQQTELSSGRVSLAGIGFESLQSHVEEHPGTIAIVGVSAMTERCGEWLLDDDVPCVVVNRSEERGRALAERLGVPYRRLDRFRQAPEPCTAVVTATGATDPIFCEAELRRLIGASGRPPLVVDFGLPPDADAAAAASLGVPHLDMEEISSRAARSRDQRQADLAVAREHVDLALLELRREAGERALAPVLKELTGRYRQTAEDGVDRLLRRQLRHLDEDQRRALQDFAHGLAKRFAHVPVVGLRALAGTQGLEAVDTFLTASDREQAWGLRRAIQGDDSENAV